MLSAFSPLSLRRFNSSSSRVTYELFCLLAFSNVTSPLADVIFSSVIVSDDRRVCIIRLNIWQFHVRLLVCYVVYAQRRSLEGSLLINPQAINTPCSCWRDFSHLPMFCFVIWEIALSFMALACCNREKLCKHYDDLKFGSVVKVTSFPSESFLIVVKSEKFHWLSREKKWHK